MAKAEIDMGRILKEKYIITVHVKMPRFWKWRFHLAGWLIWLAAHIAGLGYGGMIEEV